MRRTRLFGGLLALLTLLGLVTIFRITFRGLRLEPQRVSQMFQSPIQTPTQTPPVPRPSATPNPNFKAEAIRITGKTPLTADGRFGGSTLGVAWSPDGEKLAFTKLTGEFIPFTTPKGFAPVTDLWLANITDRTTEKIADRGKFPIWSPDGQRLAFVSPIDEKLNEIHLFDLATQKSRWIVDNGLSAMWVDSRRLAITMKEGEIRQYDRTTGISSLLSDLTAGTDGPNSLVGSPHSRWIAIVNGRNLWLVDRQDPQQRIQLTENFENVFGGLVWSPSGEKVAYVADKSIWMATIDSEIHAQVIYQQNDRGYPWALTWSPGDSVLAFHGPEGIAVINADGSGFQTLLPYGATPEESFLFPSWSPSGYMIAVEKNHNVWLLQLAIDRS